MHLMYPSTSMGLKQPAFASQSTHSLVLLQVQKYMGTILGADFFELRHLWLGEHWLPPARVEVSGDAPPGALPTLAGLGFYDS